MSLGTRIRQTRTQKGITLQELSDRSLLSKGFICQLENDKANPSLQALEKLASGLRVPIAHLFLTPAEKIHVIRKDERQQFRVGPENVLVDMLSAPRRHLNMMIMEFPPGSSTGGENHSHEGEECHLVLEGSVRCTQGEQVVVLKAGDSMHWNGFLPHRIDNPHDKPARVLCVTTGNMADMIECNECQEFLTTDCSEAQPGREDRQEVKA